jgi:hypothetical protein
MISRQFSLIIAQDLVFAAFVEEGEGRATSGNLIELISKPHGPPPARDPLQPLFERRANRFGNALACLLGQFSG